MGLKEGRTLGSCERTPDVALGKRILLINGLFGFVCKKRNK